MRKNPRQPTTQSTVVETHNSVNVEIDEELAEHFQRNFRTFDIK